jgi:hypothetical protein
MSAAASIPSRSSAPRKPSDKELRKILFERRGGLYRTEPTFNEAWLSHTQMEPTDVAFTLNHSHGVFTVMNLRELLTQIQMWRGLGCRSHDYNVKEVKFGDKTAWMFVVQPPDLTKAPTCPLAMCLNTLVSGYTYIAKDKGTADLVVRALSA